MVSELSRRRVLQGLGVATLSATGIAARQVDAADPPSLTWSRTYRSSDGESGSERGLLRAVAPAEDGYVVAGLSGADYRGWVAGVDDAGRERWQRTLGHRLSAFLGAAPAHDDGTVLAGATNLPTDGFREEDTSDPWVVRVDTDGDVIWRRTYQPAAPAGDANAVARTSEGYAVGGAVTVDGRERPWVAALDEHGTRQWQWRPTEIDRTGRVTGVIAVGSDVVAVGSDAPAGTEESHGRVEDAWAVRLTDGGDDAWRRRFEGPDGDRFEAVAPADDGVVAAGQRGFGDDDYGVGWLVALDGAGEARWQRTYPSDTWCWLHAVAPRDGGYVLVGTRERPDSETRGAWTVRVGSDGRRRWDRTYDEAYTRGFDALAAGDGGVLLAGDRSADGESLAWLAKAGGEAPPGGGSGGLSLPTVPGWTGPFLAGAGLGAVAGGAVARLLDRSGSGR